ncbi:MAG: DUF4385 domain-containing protein [Janthinobacterium lividum]
MTANGDNVIFDTRKPFDIKKYRWSSEIDYRKHPESYLVGKGEQGVLLCEPYKGEILPFWRFKTPEIARESSKKILELFYNFLKEDDFVGADMARKFLQMGFTRSRRYTNYKGGLKYDPETHILKERGTGDPQKAESATIFYAAWQEAEAVPQYIKMKKEWREKYK